jgi:hypothetical protein
MCDWGVDVGRGERAIARIKTKTKEVDLYDNFMSSTFIFPSSRIYIYSFISDYQAN